MRQGVVRWLGVLGVAALLGGAACAPGTSPTSDTSLVPPATAVATESGSTSATTLIPAVTPTATAAPAKPTATSAPAPVGTVDTTGWVKLGAIDTDLTHGLLTEDDLGSSWTLQDTVDNSLIIGLTQLTCDGSAMTPPANPVQHASVQFERSSNSTPSPQLIQINWKMPDSNAASAGLDYLTEAFRCSTWRVSGQPVDVRSYTLGATVGEKSAAVRLTVTANGLARVMTVVAFRAGSVLSEVIYVDSSPADPTALAGFAKTAAKHVADLNL